MSKILPVLAVFLWMAASSAAMAAPRSEAGAAPRLTATEATNAGRALGHAFHCISRSQEPRHGRQTSTLGGQEANVWVDQETGLPVEFSNLSYRSPDVAAPPLMTAKDAVARGSTFLRQIGIEPNGTWTLTGNRYHEPSQTDKEYDLRWVKMFHGIELASFIDVIVDANDGQIITYQLIDDPVVIPLEVNLTGQQALALVVNTKGWQHPIVEGARLQVWYAGGYPGPQTLMWSLEISNPDAKTGSDSYVRADVNATTGNIVRLGEPAGFFGPMPKGQKGASIALPKPDLKALRGAKVPPTVFQLAERKKAK